MNHEIYADHAATAPIEPLALEAMYTAYQEYANPAALYRSALHTKQTVEKARLTVAENLGCTPDHIFFTSGGSESNTWAIRGTVPQGGHVVTTPIEHHSVLNACASIRDDGGRMTTLEVDGFGRVVPESLTRALAAHPNLVSLQYANNEVGVVQTSPRWQRSAVRRMCCCTLTLCRLRDTWPSRWTASISVGVGPQVRRAEGHRLLVCARASQTAPADLRRQSTVRPAPRH